MDPHMIARSDAMTWPGTCGSFFADARTMLPVTVDKTATGWKKCQYDELGNEVGSTYSNCNILGRCKEPVKQSSHERRVEAELDR